MAKEEIKGKFKTLRITKETHDKLMEIKDMIEEDVYYSFPENDKFKPIITISNLIKTLIDEEYARLKGLLI